MTKVEISAFFALLFNVKEQGWQIFFCSRAKLKIETALQATILLGLLFWVKMRSMQDVFHTKLSLETWKLD